jgi:hypothetical protein
MRKVLPESRLQVATASPFIFGARLGVRLSCIDDNPHKAQRRFILAFSTSTFPRLAWALEKLPGESFASLWRLC